jgi:CubicO group peptidase (beta-lactamase class C family)
VKKLLAAFALSLLLLSQSFVAGAAPAQKPPAAKNDSPKTVHDTLQGFIDDHALAGVVTIVASKDKVLSQEAVGYADLAAKQPMRADSVFWIASMSKPITSAALMMLVDEGKVKLDDPVEKYLPEFKGQCVAAEKGKDPAPPKHSILVRNLLSHTAGLPFASPAEKPTLDVLPLRDAVASYAKGHLLYEPGTKHQYANAGINTAGRIIEVVSGMPYEKFLDQRLLQPLGMKDTTFWPNDEQVARLAKSYRFDAKKNSLDEIKIGQLKYPLTDRARQPMPAGGLFSTASDVLIFCRMVLAGGVYNGRRYLSEDAVREMTSTTQVGDIFKGEGGYGLGWATSRKRHDQSDPVIVGACGHGGAHSTQMWIEPQQDRVFVYMVQQAGGKPGCDCWGAFRRTATAQFGGK